VELEELSKHIASRRQELKLTQKVLAEICGVSTRTIATVEGGFEVDVGVRKISNILEALGMELDMRSARAPLSLDELNQGRT